MRRDRRLLFALLVIPTAATVACADKPNAYRGPGLTVATLPLNDVVAVYRAALAGSFRLDDPTLFILADPTFLPRTPGLVGGDRMPGDLLATLQQSGLSKGTCTVPVTNTRFPLVCPAERPGYVVRFSQPFAMGTDSVQVHLVVQQYATPSGARAERLRFERAYYVARRGSAWRAVREARLPQP
jgi:hypothetical protein